MRYQYDFDRTQCRIFPAEPTLQKYDYANGTARYRYRYRYRMLALQNAKWQQYKCYTHRTSIRLYKT